MRTVPFLLAGLLLSAAGLPARAALTPGLAQVLASAPADEFLPVALILDRQVAFADLYPRVKDQPKAARRAQVIVELKALAEASQAGLKADLEQLARAGQARNVRFLWITNAVAAWVRVDQVPGLIARHPEIVRAQWDPPRPFAQLTDARPPGEPFRGADETGWGVLHIQAPQVWSLGYQGQGVVIGSIDSGTDYNHPDLAGQIWCNPGEDLNGNGVVDPSDWNGVDDDGNGFVDDLRGWAFDTHSSEVMDADPTGHGTAVAGIVVGDGTGGNVTGIAPQAKLMTLKMWSGSESNYWEAQQYAVDMPVDVITSSLSYKWRYHPHPDYATMRHNTDMELAAGIIRSNSIGNEGDNLNTDPLPFNIATPGNCPPPWLPPDQTLAGGLSSTMGAGAFNPNLQIAYYSSLGPAAWCLGDILALDPGYSWAAAWPALYDDYPYSGGDSLGLLKPDVAAPTSVLTTLRGGGYSQGFNGTSAAAPHLGGSLCLVLSADPSAAPEVVSRVVQTTALDMGLPGKDNTWGCGRLNVYAAVALRLAEISGAVCGTVTSANSGQSLAGIEVDLLGQQAWTVTDTAGYYILPGIPSGTYTVRFAAAGYDTLTVPGVVLQIGQLETLNVALTGPSLVVETASLQATLAWGQTLQLPVVLRNAGGSNLDVSFQKQGDWLPYAPFSIIQAQAQTGDEYLLGVEAAQGSIWISGAHGTAEPNYVYQFSYAGQLLAALEQPPGPSPWGWRDLAWDGQLLWGSSGPQLQGMDLDGVLRDSIAGPLGLHRALAYDPAADRFYAADDTCAIVAFGRDGAVVDSWPHNLHIHGLAWHPQEPVGCPLYVFSQDGGPVLLRVSRLNLATGQMDSLTTLVGAPGDQAGGCAISGEIDPDCWGLLALVQSVADRVQIHSLNAYAPWLTLDPPGGTIPPGGCLEALALLDAGTVPPGEYGVGLAVQHNAPGPPALIPAGLTVGPSGVNGPAPATPAAFRLFPAHPNPFNQHSALSYQLSAKSHVRLRVFDIAGREVRILVNGWREAGVHEVSFDAAGLASGLYLLRLEAQTAAGAREAQTVKAVVLK
ncbi:MAG: hypothetical protein C4524_06015 [Candidatus Zixiibacteriota bacterium]|nr:MAG: hypothetical protein C4524_06015 [candidate division Zixibacteria bacterium]